MPNILKTSASHWFTQSQQRAATSGDAADIAKDLSWIDMLKGIAIIGVFFENWLTYFFHHKLIAETNDLFYSLTSILNAASGPFVQVFIILSGFGLTLTYLKNYNAGWRWKSWTWRRVTKIVFPYYLFVILSFIIGLIGSCLYEKIDVQFSWHSLITLLTFTRNFYLPSWVWNPPLWYMPVIIGLYIIFPLLVSTLRKWGPIKLLLISAFFSITSLIAAFGLGITGSHGTDLFLFWTFQFAMGMALAHVVLNHPERLRLLIGIFPFAIGAVLIFISWILRTYVLNGNIFNDVITSPGIFLVLLNTGWFFCRIFLAAKNIFISLAEPSYFMYLIHYPIMMFLIGPAFTNSVHPLIAVLLGGIYIPVIYYLCKFISKPITKISAKLNAII